MKTTKQYQKVKLIHYNLNKHYCLLIVLPAGFTSILQILDYSKKMRMNYLLFLKKQ